LSIVVGTDEGDEGEEGEEVFGGDHEDLSGPLVLLLVRDDVVVD
jgi:hypothetical protein